MATTETDPAVTEEEIDWSNLPSDIVNLIAERVATNLDDYIKFRAICPSWRSVTVGPRHVKFPPQLPWLLLSATNANPLSFISICDSKPRSLPLPEATGKKILFSSDGWLVLEEYPTKISLLNPLTSMLIHLPPLPPCDGIEEKDISMLAIAMSSSSANSTIMAIIGQRPMLLDHDPKPPTMLIGLRSGSSAWTMVKRIRTFQDVIYYKESFYTTTMSGRVLVFNAELVKVMGGKVPAWYYPSSEVPMLPCQSPLRLVESSGELLMVQRLLTSTERTSGFDIFKLSSVDGSLRFAQVHSLGDQMIFLGSHGRAVSLPAKDHPPHKGNRIYCSEENILVRGENCKYKSGGFGPLLFGFSISRSIEENCWTSFSGTTTWHVPRLC